MAAVTLLLTSFLPSTTYSMSVDQTASGASEPKILTEPQSLEVSLPISVNGVEQAVEVVKITASDNPEILFFYTKPMIDLLSNLLVPEKTELLKSTLGQKIRFKPRDLLGLGIIAKYDRLGVVNIETPLDWLKNKDILFARKDYGSLTPNTFPSNFSGQLSLSGQNNYSARKDFSSNQSYLTAALTLNAFGAVINSGVKKNDKETNRTETNLTLPISKYSQVILGDIIGIGDTSTQISGVGFSRLSDSGARSATTMSQAIEIPTLSKIEVYRNEVLLKEFQANPGKVSFADLPISIGNNVIKIVVTDVVTGKKTEETFSEFIPLLGEKRGEYSFIFAAGKSRRSINDQISYLDGDSLLSELKYGVSNNLTLGINGKLNDYSGLLGLNQTLIFNNFAARLNESKGISAMGVQNEYQVSFSKSNNMPLINNISLELKKIVMERPIYDYTESVLSANTSFKPFYDISLTAGYNQYRQSAGMISSGSFLSASRRIYSGRNLSISSTIGSSFYSNDKPNNTELKINFTYQDTLEAGALSVYGTNNSRGTNAQALLRADDINYSAGYSVESNSEKSSKSLGLSKNGYLGTIAGTYSNNSEGSTYLVNGSTAVYFAGSAFGFGRPLSESFLIIENEGERGDFDVSNRYGDSVSGSKIFNSAVTPVGDYSVSSFNATPTDIENYSLELTKSYIFKSGFRSGGAVKFTNSSEILVITRVVDEAGNSVGPLDLELKCRIKGKKSKQPLFTDNEGALSFSVERGSKCRLSTPEYESKEIGLDFMVKYKELEDIKIFKKKGVL